MKTYKPNYRYWLLLIFGTVFIVIFLVIGLIELIIGNYFTLIPLLSLVLVLLYFFLFAFTKEVTIEGINITFKTEVRTHSFTSSQIRKIRTFQSINALLWHFGDKERTPLTCKIRLKDHPLSYLIFSNEINDHKDLYSRISALINEAGVCT